MLNGHTERQLLQRILDCCLGGSCYQWMAGGACVIACYCCGGSSSAVWVLVFVGFAGRAKNEFLSRTVVRVDGWFWDSTESPVTHKEGHKSSLEFERSLSCIGFGCFVFFWCRSDGWRMDSLGKSLVFESVWILTHWQWQFWPFLTSPMQRS